MPILVTVTVHVADAAGQASGNPVLDPLPFFFVDADPCEAISILMAAIARIRAAAPLVPERQAARYSAAPIVRRSVSG